MPDYPVSKKVSKVNVVRRKQYVKKKRRQNIINSSASAPLNATKIPVKKVSDVDVCIFGPEL